MINLAPFLEKRRSLAAFPQALHSAEDILKGLVDPLIEALRLTGRWMSLEEAMQQSGRSTAYFRAKLDSLGGKCRLEVWAEQGLAFQAGRQWSISPSVVPQRKRRVTRSSCEEMTVAAILQSLEETEA